MEEKLNKVNLLGSTINNWTKVIVGVVIFISSISVFYYQVRSNTEANTLQDAKIERVLEKMTESFDEVIARDAREFEIIQNRASKRYKRIVKEIDKIHDEDDKQDKLILDLYKEIYYLKGVDDGKER